MSKLNELNKELEAARMEHDAAAAHIDKTLEHIKELEHKVIQEEAHQANMSEVRKVAKQLRDVYDAFKEAGFSEKQSFSLVNTMVHASLAPNAPAPNSVGKRELDELLCMIMG